MKTDHSPFIEPSAERWAQSEPLPLVLNVYAREVSLGLPSLSSISEQVESPNRTPAPILTPARP